MKKNKANKTYEAPSTNPRIAAMDPRIQNMYYSLTVQFAGFHEKTMRLDGVDKSGRYYDPERLLRMSDQEIEEAWLHAFGGEIARRGRRQVTNSSVSQEALDAVVGNLQRLQHSR